jgi:Pregnancy-associated plasma protein-A
MTRFYTLLFIIFLGLMHHTQAQSNANPAGPIHTCGFDDVMTQKLNGNPELKKQFEANELVIKQYIARQRQSRTAATVYTIPVVVHVIHAGGAIGSLYNPSDATVQGAIAGLNSFWRKGLSTSGGADIELNFTLATRAPNCGTTTGIDRIDGSILAGYTTYGINGSGTTGAPETDVKNLSRWSNQDYVNIWVVNKIDGFDGTSGSGVVGYAYFPGASANVDGIVLVAAVMTQNDRTLAHEMGHVFNLYHTFQGDGSGSTCPATETDCGTQGDRVCDTERHKRGNCVTVPTLNTCTGANYAIADVAQNYTVLNNYMNYASANCANMFSDGQKTRIRAALDGTRANLKNGYGFNTNPLGTLSSTISVDPPYTTFTSGTTTTYYLCSGSGATLTAASPAFAAYQWQKDGSNIPNATANTYTATTAGTYRLILTPCGGSAVTSNTINVAVYPVLTTATISPATTRFCTGSTLTLTANTDAFFQVNAGYQWFKDGTAIGGATAQTLTISTGGSYRVQASRCGVTVSSTTQTITAGAAPATACTPTFTNSPGNYFGLLNLTLDGINASSGTSNDDGRYVDRSCVYAATVPAGSSVPFSVRTANVGYVKLFLDKANTGSFTEVASIQTTGGTTSPGSGSFALPAGTLTGTALRLRVATTYTGYGAASIVTACALNESADVNGYGSGQIEDFSLVVTGSLPVELLSFDARKNADKTVTLAWATATETDNGQFRIERSRDLMTFNTLATVEGHGDSQTRSDYTLPDAHPYPGQNYYRLTQTDRNGTQHSYRPVSVFVDSDAARLSAWPNPAPNKSFVVSQPDVDGAAIRVVDVLGRSVSFSREILTIDQLQITLPKQQPMGVYLIQVQQGLTQQIIRVVVE